MNCGTSVFFLVEATLHNVIPFQSYFCSADIWVNLEGLVVDCGEQLCCGHFSRIHVSLECSVNWLN